MNQVKDCRNYKSKKGSLQISWPREVGEVQAGKAGYKGEACQDISSKKYAKRVVIGQTRLASRSRGLVLKKYADKGKKKWCKRKVVRPRGPAVQNGKLILEKKKNYELAGGVRSSESSSSLEDDLREKVFLESSRERGECSLVKAGRVVRSGPKNFLKPKDVSFRLASEGPKKVPDIAGEGFSSDSIATKEHMVQVVIEAESQFQCDSRGDQIETEEAESVSSDN
ncbi:hypothetical protein LWI29_010726 [Acer saccharum]|uniref:Uncharacterized protein n=1 Tax=Acer saccharum TaxID=4024 RepID=A0AA39W2L0_ACESA|nr:hypothetical protein LWI29_010726 [Acer saccharum]